MIIIIQASIMGYPPRMPPLAGACATKNTPLHKNPATR